MELIPVRSSNLSAVGYDPFEAVLTIAFHGGRIYDYFCVPLPIYWGLMAAMSHGKFFHARIKNRYAYRRLT